MTGLPDDRSRWPAWVQVTAAGLAADAAAVTVWALARLVLWSVVHWEVVGAGVALAILTGVALSRVTRR